MQLVYDTKNQLTIPVTIVIPENMKNVVSLQFSKYVAHFEKVLNKFRRKSTLYAWHNDGSLWSYLVDFTKL